MPPPQPFSTIRRLLESHGWRLTRIRGSHHVFTKTGELPISIPVHHGKVKTGYVKRIEKLIAKEDGPQKPQR